MNSHLNNKKYCEQHSLYFTFFFSNINLCYHTYFCRDYRCQQPLISYVKNQYRLFQIIPTRLAPNFSYSVKEFGYRTKRGKGGFPQKKWAMKQQRRRGDKIDVQLPYSGALSCIFSGYSYGQYWPGTKQNVEKPCDKENFLYSTKNILYIKVITII